MNSICHRCGRYAEHKVHSAVNRIYREEFSIYADVEAWLTCSKCEGITYFGGSDNIELSEEYGTRGDMP